MFKKILSWFRKPKATPVSFSPELLDTIKANTAMNAFNEFRPLPSPLGPTYTYIPKYFMGTEDMLKRARDYAESFAKTNGTVTADDVQNNLRSNGYDLGPAAGSLFKDKRFYWTGSYINSVRTKNKGRLLRVYALWNYDALEISNGSR